MRKMKGIKEINFEMILLKTEEITLWKFVTFI